MTESSQLETKALVKLPTNEALSGRFPIRGNVEVSPEAGTVPGGFGEICSDHMAWAKWTTETGWADHQIKPYGPIELDPAAMVLHYGQEIFEGMKAYRHQDGSIWTFRPAYNAVRFAASARRMAMPTLDTETFVASLVDLVNADHQWVPEKEGASLYLRPMMIATEKHLGVRPAQEYLYMCIAAPVNAFFSSGFQAVPIWVTPNFHRAAPGGTGMAKTGGNYAGSLLPQREAEQKGFRQVCFLDAREEKYLEELGGMNIFVVYADGSVKTPALTGTILEGGTRSAIITLLRDMGRTVTEDHIAIKELVSDLKSGKATEVFVCGTAAVVAPVGRLASEEFDVEISDTTTSQAVYEQLTGIQFGKVEDKYGWMYRLR